MKWIPEGEGKAFSFSPSLMPLESFRDQLVILSELRSEPAEALGDGSGDHARASGAWLSGAHPRKTEGGTSVRVRPSISLPLTNSAKILNFPRCNWQSTTLACLGAASPGTRARTRIRFPGGRQPRRCPC